MALTKVIKVWAVLSMNTLKTWLSFSGLDSLTPHNFNLIEDFQKQTFYLALFIW